MGVDGGVGSTMRRWMSVRVSASETTIMTRYRYVTEWSVDAPVERVWSLLLDNARWPEWWKGFAFVHRLRDGDDSGVGMVLRQGWRSLLPYTLTFDLEIDEVVGRERLAGRVTGDMVGTCSWTFSPLDDGTRVTFLMDVTPGRWWMNLPVPFARRIFSANFDAVMRWGGEGIARELRVPVGHRSMEAASAAA
jgi:hypothetical protein